MNTVFERKSLPFLPPDRRSAGGTRPRDHLIRAAVASVVAKTNARDSNGVTSNVFTAMWPEDNISPTLLSRAAVSPMSTTSVPTLAATAVADFVANVPQSAASKLIAAGNRLDMTGVQSISLPMISTGFTPAWVGEGAPMPVPQLLLSDVDLGPMKKAAIITAWTYELANSSAIEALVRLALNDAAARTLDGTLFSTAAATSTKPAGLLNGLTPVTASTADGYAAMQADLGALAAAVVTAGGSADGIVFIVSDRQAVGLRLIGIDIEFPTFASPSVAPGTVIAIDAREFYSAVGSEPRFSVSESVDLHFEGSTPLAIGTEGSPPTVAAPTRSAFQSGLVALRMTIDVAYSMRTPAVAYTTGVAW